jgi:hypothetical protein
MKNALVALSLAGLTLATKKCDILFDGRVPWSATLADFEKSTSIYNNQYILGQSEEISSILVDHASNRL